MKIPLLENVLNYGGRIWWAPTMVNQFSNFIEKGDRVLDIGAGGGWIGKHLSISREAVVTLLDVKDMNRTNLPLHLYDGTTIPFPNASFDDSLLSFVLHHCEDPLRVLSEAVRVSKKRIIIFEDTFRTPLEKFLACANDWIANFPLFLSHPFQMNMPLHYKRIAEWEDVFEKFSLEVKFKKITQHILTRHVLFILEKCKNK